MGPQRGPHLERRSLLRGGPPPLLRCLPGAADYGFFRHEPRKGDKGLPNYSVGRTFRGDHFCEASHAPAITSPVGSPTEATLPSRSIIEARTTLCNSDFAARHLLTTGDVQRANCSWALISNTFGNGQDGIMVHLSGDSIVQRAHITEVLGGGISFELDAPHHKLCSQASRKPSGTSSLGGEDMDGELRDKEGGTRKEGQGGRGKTHRATVMDLSASTAIRGAGALEYGSTSNL